MRDVFYRWHRGRNLAGRRSQEPVRASLSELAREKPPFSKRKRRLAGVVFLFHGSMYVIIHTYMQALSKPPLLPPAARANCLAFSSNFAACRLFDLPSLAGKRYNPGSSAPASPFLVFYFPTPPTRSLPGQRPGRRPQRRADALRPELSKRLLSTATASFSNARKRLPLAFLSGCPQAPGPAHHRP